MLSKALDLLTINEIEYEYSKFNWIFNLQHAAYPAEWKEAAKAMQIS